MKYGKIENGAFIEAPKVIHVYDRLIGERVIYNPSEKTLVENGYKPVIEMPCPETEEDKYYEYSYEEQGDNIVKVWIEAEPPVEEAPQPTEMDLLKATQERQSRDITDIQLAVCEIYEALGGKE